jgi:hypothetical protein
MSLDIHYITCNFDTRVLRKNPFTGKIQSVSAPDTLTQVERAAVLRLLREVGADDTDQFGAYPVELPDGGSADVSAIEDEETNGWIGLLICLRTISPRLAKLLWELCRDGNMAAVPVVKGEDPIVLVANEKQRERAFARWSSPVIADSPDRLVQLLRSSCATTSAFQALVNEPNVKACTSSRENATSVRRHAKDLTVLDLESEAADIRNYILTRVAEFDPRTNVGPGRDAPIKMAYAGYEFEQAGWFGLVFDRRPDAEHDGEWTMFLEGNMLDRPRWAAARMVIEKRPIQLRGADGRIRDVSDWTELGRLLGRMLVDVLKGAESDGVFTRLPRAEGFHLGLEEFNGLLGWDSQEGVG